MIYNRAKYETKVPYPHINDFTKWYVYEKGKVILDGVDYQEFLKYQKDNPKCNYDKVADQERFIEARRLYSEDAARLAAEYEQELFASVGYPDKICSIVYSKAYDQSHAWGYEEVENTFFSLLEFVEDILEVTK
jgi:hypothetical protein